MTVIWRQHALSTFYARGRSGTKDLSSSLPRLCTLSRTHTKYQRSEESHTLSKRSLSPQWTLSIFFFTLVRNGYELVRSPTTRVQQWDSLKKRKLRKRLESARDVQARGNALGKSGKIDPFSRAIEGREAR